MRKLYVYLSIVFILSFSAYGQKETYNWFYGYGQGITWNQTQTFEGIPIDAPNTRVTLTGIPSRYEPQSVRPQMYPLKTNEGCFSLSDENGNLLFYSDGMTIYNANHQVMENGTNLSGNKSSAQSGIIIPFPRNRKKYVAVTIGIHNNGEFGYSILDTEANNGLGKVELPKNRSFTLPLGATKRDFLESVAATKHANGMDYWIIAVQRVRQNSKLVAWLLTEDGISDTPITSVIPNVSLSNTEGSYGYLKIAPNGKYFALMLAEKNNLLWGEFNNRTGEFTNMNDYYSLTGTSINTYGGEFSPSNNYLYVTKGSTETTIANVFDFRELLRQNTTPLRSFVVQRQGYSSGTIQLGPDYRMYLTMYSVVESSSYPSILYLFDTPNDPLNTKVYALENLAPGTGSPSDGFATTRLGLPSFVSSFFMEAQGTSTICIGEEAVYSVNSSLSRMEIDFGEGDTPVVMNNVSEIKHFFKKPGNYIIKIRPINNLGEILYDETKTIYTTVYSCYLPVNHNLTNAEY